MRPEELFEKQYGQKKIKYKPQRQFLGLRKFLKRFDLDRLTAVESFVTPGERVLDIGCGEGSFLRRLSGKFKELYGLDISGGIIQEAICKTRQQYSEDTFRFRWIHGNADEPLPFPNDFFDAVVSISTLQLMFDVFHLVKEIARVLKPRGYVVIEVPNIAYLPNRIGLLLGRLPKVSSALNWEEVGWDGGVIHYFTMKTLCWLFELNGFSIKAKAGSGFLANMRGFWPSLLTGDLIIRAEKND